MHNAFMSEMRERLKRARIAAGFQDATEAAGALGIPAATYLAHEGGTRGFYRSVERYATFFGVNSAWLLAEQGPMKREPHPLIEKFEKIAPEARPAVLDFLDYMAAKNPNQR